LIGAAGAEGLGLQVADRNAVALAKQNLRSTAKRIRASLPPDLRDEAAHRIAGHGIGFAGLPQGAVVAGYIAIGEEIDPLPLLQRINREGYRLALPLVREKGAPLSFRAWQPGDPLAEARWGLREPLPDAPEVEPDTLLVPLLAFDAQGYRLGYGGGFYDRTIAMARSSRGLVAIGLAYDEQEVPAVPRLDFDQRLDWVLTPSGPRNCAEGE